ncbi:putative oxalocrotonate tautomerase enzyme-domain-containing protein [Aspergillus falconensis]
MPPHPQNPNTLARLVHTEKHRPSPPACARVRLPKVLMHVAVPVRNLDIPAFLVNVFFHENRIGTFYSAGKTPPTPNNVFFVLDHAARSFPSDEARLASINSVNRIVEPILAPKGVKWEYNIYEHPADIWRENGMIAPVQQEEIWEQWMDLNEPVKYGEYLAKQEK